MSQGSGSPESFGPTRFETGDPILLGGLRRRHAFAAAEPGLAAQWREFSSFPPLPGRIGSNLYGVMCGADATGFEYMCAVQVESLAALPDGLGRMRVPAQRYAVFGHLGDISTLRSTWQRIFEWLASGRYESAHLPDFEIYGAGTDPLGASPTTTVIEVWVGVKDR